MPGFTAYGKNAAMDGIRAIITHIGAMNQQTGKSVTGVASTDVFTSTSHGYSNGDLVVLSGMTGGAGLVAGDPYYIIASAANTFQLARTSGGTAVDFTTDLTAGTVARIVEISGGSYARQAIAYAAAADGQIDDTTNGASIPIPAGSTVSAISFHTASTAGNVVAVVDVPDEPFTNAGNYVVSDAKLNMNAG